MSPKITDVWGQEIKPGTLVRYSTDARIIRYGIYLGTITRTKTRKSIPGFSGSSWQATDFVVAGNNSAQYNSVRWKCNLSRLKYAPDYSFEIVQEIVSPTPEYTKMITDLKTFAEQQMIKFAGKFDP